MTRKQRKKAAAAARNMNAACPIPASPETQSPEPTMPDDLTGTYFDKFQPADSIEDGLVEQMMSAQSKQRCLARIEEVAMARLMSASDADLPAAFEQQSKFLASLDRARKEAALQFSRALASLTKLRAFQNSAKSGKTGAPPAPQPQPDPPPSQPEQPAAPIPPTLDFPDFCELDLPSHFFADAIDSTPSPALGLFGSANGQSRMRDCPPSEHQS